MLHSRQKAISLVTLPNHNAPNINNVAKNFDTFQCVNFTKNIQYSGLSAFELLRFPKQNKITSTNNVTLTRTGFYRNQDPTTTNPQQNTIV
jgi:hypothetical protein